MSLLENLTVDADVEGQNEDYIPGSGGFVMDTGVYPMTIDLAYLGESQGGAMNVTVWLKEVDGNRSHRETFYVTSGKAKGQKNTFTDKSGKKRLLPGMEAMNQLALITTGKPLAGLTPEAKTVKLWDFEERKELPKEVPVLTDMLQQPVLVCITKRRENKRQNVGGEWIDTNEAREFNEVSKFLHPSGHTVAEKKAKEEAEYRVTWESKFGPDYIADRYKAVDGGAIANASNAAAADNSAEVNTLFDDDDEDDKAAAA